MNSDEETIQEILAIHTDAAGNVTASAWCSGGCQFSQSDINLTARQMFFCVKDIIGNGQVEALLDLEKHIDFSTIVLERASGPDELLAAKDIFIAFCTMLFQQAVDVGLSKSRMLQLADQQIDKVQRMSQLQDVLAQMRASVATFTYTVYLDLVSRNEASIEAIQNELMSAICAMPS